MTRPETFAAPTDFGRESETVRPDAPEPKADTTKTEAPKENGKTCSEEEEEQWARAQEYADQQEWSDTEEEPLDLPEGADFSWQNFASAHQAAMQSLEEAIEKVPESNRKAMEEFLKGRFLAVKTIDRKDLK